ncbi:MAG: segregation/condensation protein A, partial [Planctomycetia bacterium]|nr:segregation/condensation protein A [Planctomycetia bacterium]
MLTVKLDIFRGPLDLLLFLIKRKELNIEDIRVSEIIDQFNEYVDILEFIDFDLAGEFVAMAGWLLEMCVLEALPGEAEPVIEEE